MSGHDKVRCATEADIPCLLALSERFHGNSHWKGVVPFDSASTEASIRHFIASDDIGFFVSGDINGLIVAIMVPVYFNSSRKMAMELCWYSESPRTGLKLLSEAEKWAADKGCAVWMVGTQATSASRLEAVYARKGYKPFSRGYLKELN